MSSSTTHADDGPEAISIEPQAGYVGSETCARCHANTNFSLKQTWHAKILLPSEEAAVLGDFVSQDPDLTFTLEDIQWVLGGQYKQRYLTNIDGDLYVLPAEWNVETGEWVPYEVDSWRSRPYNQYCAGCHTTGYDPATQTWLEPGVGCEACHGPGADHVASTGDRGRIINPAELQFRNQAEICAQCHSRGYDPSGEFPFPVGYRPGGPAELDETFLLSTDPDDFWPDGTAKRHHMQYQDWRQGVHGNSVGCIFCHTSHSVGETDHQTRMVGNDRCLICHEGNRDLADHIPYMATAAEQVHCTDCHMPQISKLVPTDFQIRGHTFRPPNPALSIAYGGQEKMPNSCNFCHVDKSPNWASAILGQETPPTNATRVPAPTQPAIPTSIVMKSIEPGGEERTPPSQPDRPKNYFWLCIAGIATLGGLLGAPWVYRKVRTR